MHIYLGTFLIALSTLALEITFTRLLSVTAWYHLAFFCIATAMLGMTAGAVTVYLRPEWFDAPRRATSAARACVAYAVATPFSLVLLCVLPLVFWPDFMSAVVMLLATFACSLPFYCAGIAIAAALTRFELPPGRIYAADLAGASLGCLVVLAGLELMDAPSLILLCGALGVAAAAAYAWRETQVWEGRAPVLVGLFLLVIAYNFVGEGRIRPLFIKHEFDLQAGHTVDRWNSFSRVVVYDRIVTAPTFWGPSPKTPELADLPQYPMNIDGLAGTTLGRFASREDIEYLRYDVTNVAHYLRPRGSSVVIGVGGGRDIQSALLFGHDPVLGIDVNPIFIDLLRGRFREFAGLAGRPDVRLVVDEARSHLASSDERFSLIQMSLIDTWAATGAGAFSLSENGLYTIEAWRIFTGRLAEDGLFTVSRWYAPENLGETGRLVSLAVASVLDRGRAEPDRHIAMATAGQVATLILSARPFTTDEIRQLREVATRLGYALPIVPGERPVDPLLATLVSAPSIEALHERVADERLNFTPPTDETPFFFNMLRLSDTEIDLGSNEGLLVGNQLATSTLILLIQCLAILAVATILVPLILAPKAGSVSDRVPVAGAIYFSAIGAGFMLLEIGLLQRLSVFLGHPVYALGVILFSLIASTGLGSFLSERLPIDRPLALIALPVVAVVVILGLRGGLASTTASFETASRAAKIGIAVATLLPVGVMLGFFFPTGMRIAAQVGRAATPWYWALNGIFGVLCSALAVFFSIYFGIATNYSIAAGCYAIAGVSLYALSGLRSSAVA